MEGAKALLWSLVLIAALVPRARPSPATAPAFLWSPHYHGSAENAVKEIVDYRTISQKELATAVLSDGGWSSLLCSGENPNQDVDIALAFIGRELKSSDISKTNHADPALLDLLKVSFTSSNFSMAFPYVTSLDENPPLENSLVSGLVDNCKSGVELDRISYLDSCSVNHEKSKKLQGLHSLMDFVSSRMERRGSGQTDLIVFCSDNTVESEHAQSEGEVLSYIVKFLQQSGAKYTVLYASEPYRSLQYTSDLALSRFLAESTFGNASGNSTLCDGVCQIKSSLLEAIFVSCAVCEEIANGFGVCFLLAQGCNVVVLHEQQNH